MCRLRRLLSCNSLPSEIRRHEKQLAVQQDTRAAREQFLKDTKALKLTTIMTTVLVLCSIPGVLVAVLLSRNGGEVSPETRYMLFCLSGTKSFLNSLFNPIIYSVRMRQFRVAFVELLCKTVHITEAEAIEMRIFGAANAVIRLEAGQDQQNMRQANYNNHDVLLQNEDGIDRREERGEQ